MRKMLWWGRKVPCPEQDEASCTCPTFRYSDINSLYSALKFRLGPAFLSFDSCGDVAALELRHKCFSRSRQKGRRMV